MKKPLVFKIIGKEKIYFMLVFAEAGIENFRGVMDQFQAIIAGWTDNPK